MNYIRIGTVINTHGLKGELKISSESDFDDIRYKKGNTVYLECEAGMKPFQVQTYRVHKGFPLVSFTDHTDINLVEQYKGCGVYIDAKDRQDLPEGEYYRDQLEGLCAVDEEGASLGTVVAVEETMGAQNNLRIRDPEGKEFLVPNVPAFVVKVDLSEKKIVIRRIEGLL